MSTGWHWSARKAIGHIAPQRPVVGAIADAAHLNIRAGGPNLLLELLHHAVVLGGEAAVTGSVHYISPEQAKGDHTDARTDIYSVGVMMYEMLSGKLPFDGTGAVSIAIMQISEKPKPLAEVAPNIPVGLRQITEKAMEKDPADRYQSAQEMLDAIAAFRRNPSISFEYEYNTQDNPDKTINRVVSSSTAKTAGKAAVSTSQARRAVSSVLGAASLLKKVYIPKYVFPLEKCCFAILHQRVANIVRHCC